MPRAIGFSTGSLAYGDYPAALESLRCTTATAVELSALRERELAPLMRDLKTLDVAQFGHVSIHAPSALHTYDEADIMRLLSPAREAGYMIIVHADVITHHRAWRKLGRQLCIENMDKRKRTGRTASELRDLLDSLPQARLCLDLAHARQVDPSLSETIAILCEFPTRIGQLHVSELNAESRHESLSYGAVAAIQSILGFLPTDVPAILEYHAPPPEVNAHLEFAAKILSGLKIREAG
ncbi:MAG: hypothetical protein IH987_16355 [Planctomycetes bacterium]|nr:hypothetical protein [Planctomycetota bacterium]